MSNIMSELLLGYIHQNMVLDMTRYLSLSNCFFLQLIYYQVVNIPTSIHDHMAHYSV